LKIRRKGASIAFTATLLASLIAVVAAPFASAAAPVVTSAGTVPRAGASTGTASFQFTEQDPDGAGPITAADCFFSVPGDGAVHPNPAIVVQIKDSALGATVGFSGTPVVTGPGSLGATASLSNTGGHAGDTLTINFASSDDANPEQVTVSGLTVNADAAAATGAIRAQLVGGSEVACVAPLASTATATGNLVSPPPYPIGSTLWTIALTAGSCPFAITGGNVGKLNFVTNPESRTVVAAPAPVAGVQTGVSTAGDPSVNAHFAGEAVNQTVNNCAALLPQTIGSPGTVADALTVTSSGATQVLPGENNQPAGSVTISDTPSGTATSLNGQTITLTITSPASGVVFSVAPPVTYAPGTGVSGPATCSLSVDRKSCTITGITDTALAGGAVTIGPITLDVDSTVPLGTAVKVSVVTSPTLAVNGGSVTIAFVGRVIVATAAQPTVFIGFNDQPTGMITFTESGAGFFVAGLGGNNTFAICPKTGEAFTRAPWAVVTTGDLKLLSGLVGASQVKGTLFVNLLGETCAYWTVYSASTVASTIEIRGSADDTNPLPSGANNGPRINVPKSGFGATPGSTQMSLHIGTFAQVNAGTGFNQILSNAIRVFKNNITATASSQPRCAKGSTDCLGGNITVTETQNGQFKAGDLITVRILPRATTQRQDVILKTGNTNDLPIVTANTAATGFAVTPVGVNCPPSAILGTIVCQFSFSVTQQAFGPGLASFSITNIHYIVAADAVDGPILVEITNTPGAGQPLDVVVSNAIIGAAPVVITTKVQAASAVGKTNNAASFSVGTKVIVVNPASNNIATIRIKLDPALVGKSVQIQVATKTGTTWSAFVTVTTRVVGSDGYAYYYASSKTAKWLSFRGNFPGLPGYGTSRSQTVQVRWI